MEMNYVYKYVLLTFIFLPESKSDRKLTHMCNFGVELLIFLHSKLQFWSFSYIFVATSSNHVTWLHLKVNICGIAANKLKIAAL